MGVSCKRVGCRVPATTTVVINPPTSTVTLVDVEVSPMGVTLCSVHATSVTPPMNWVLIDDRDGDLRLLPGRTGGTEADERIPAVAPPPEAPTPRRPRRRRPVDDQFAWGEPPGPADPPPSRRSA